MTNPTLCIQEILAVSPVSGDFWTLGALQLRRTTFYMFAFVNINTSEGGQGGLPICFCDCDSGNNFATNSLNDKTGHRVILLSGPIAFCSNEKHFPFK